jgi:NAD(P)-dependent dehydrogenase (short-subunit alcohol dehydrogenase family)
LKLSGKIAIVTGAGGGIGRAAALSLAMRGVALVLVRCDERPSESLWRDAGMQPALAIIFRTAARCRYLQGG